MSSVPVPSNLAWHSSTLAILCMWEHSHICGHWWSTDHLGDKHKNSPEVQQTQGQNWRRICGKCHPPCELGTNTGTTKELVCFNSSSCRPSLTVNRGTDGAERQSHPRFPPFSPELWFPCFLPLLQYELLPKPTVKCKHHSLQEEKNPHLFGEFSFGACLAHFGAPLVHTQSCGGFQTILSCRPGLSAKCRLRIT